MITGAAFVDLSAAYDIVTHRILIQKIFNTTRDSPLCRVIQNMLSSSRFYVELNNEHSKWRNQKNGLPQGSVLSPVLFNIYTNDQPIYPGTRSFIYAHDLCVTAQYPSFTEVEKTIEDALEEITQYYRSISLRANPDKTQVTAFYIRNNEAKKIVKSQMEQYRTREHGPAQVLRCHSGPHTELQTICTQYKGESGNTQQSSAEICKLEVGHKCKHDQNQDACFLGNSVAEYAAPVWARSDHAHVLDSEETGIKRIPLSIWSEPNNVPLEVLKLLP